MSAQRCSVLCSSWNIAAGQQTLLSELIAPGRLSRKGSFGRVPLGPATLRPGVKATPRPMLGRLCSTSVQPSAWPQVLMILTAPGQLFPTDPTTSRPETSCRSGICSAHAPWGGCVHRWKAKTLLSPTPRPYCTQPRHSVLPKHSSQVLQSFDMPCSSQLVVTLSKTLFPKKEAALRSHQHHCPGPHP